MSAQSKTKNIMLPVVMISLALALRQMSMTIVAPFISTYCKSLAGYTPLLAGLAVGAFGLMQALFQIPFGILSDRYGNKRVLLSGLVVVIIGFVLGFFARSIWMLILARVLQGSGAVIGVGYSWVAGLADDQSRTKAMSILGAFISGAAALAFAVGPLLRGVMSVSWMFLAGAVLLSVNSFYILFFLKDTGNGEKTSLPQRGEIAALLRNRTFVTMNMAAFLNNFMMMSVFYAAPIDMDQVTGQNGMWKIFVPAIIVAIPFLKAMIRWVDKGHVNAVLLVAFAVSFLSILFYFRPSSFLFLLLGTTFFLCGYITIATVAATRANEVLEDNLRGTGNGIFNSFQYIGNFGGALATGAVWGTSPRAAWLIVIAVGVAGFLMIIFNRPSSAEKPEKEDFPHEG
ncbi:MFS transporter [Ruminococcaceae bacterium BL-6]|nr:MFS transporter [Ruminococcaceae bacterium BL-6]